jgi:predicted HicB family RNase H-like nuclease
LESAASPWLSAAAKAGRKPPDPIAEKQFKGRFPLRLPEDLRRRLELEAKRKGVSLNQLILQRIA